MTKEEVERIKVHVTNGASCSNEKVLSLIETFEAEIAELKKQARGYAVELVRIGLYRELGGYERCSGCGWDNTRVADYHHEHCKVKHAQRLLSGT